MSANEIKMALQEWADKFNARIEKDLQMAWADLELRLRKLVDDMGLRELTLGPGTHFQDQLLRPEIENWTKTYVTPILEDAEKELRELNDLIHIHRNSSAVPGDWNGTLRFDDTISPGLAMAGMGLGVAALVLGISKATTWLIFTVIVVNWWLVIIGLGIGVILLAVGSTGTFTLQAKLRDRFREQLVPKIQEAILGDAFEYEGKKVPSVRRQLIDLIERSKMEALRALDGGIC